MTKASLFKLSLLILRDKQFANLPQRLCEDPLAFKANDHFVINDNEIFSLDLGVRKREKMV